MTLKQIKKAVDQGKRVFWSNGAYEVQKIGNDYFITNTFNKHRIGLTYQDGKTLNAKEEDFFTVP